MPDEESILIEATLFQQVGTPAQTAEPPPYKLLQLEEYETKTNFSTADDQTLVSMPRIE